MTSCDYMIRFDANRLGPFDSLSAIHCIISYLHNHTMVLFSSRHILNQSWTKHMLGRCVPSAIDVKEQRVGIRMWRGFSRHVVQSMCIHPIPYASDRAILGRFGLPIIFSYQDSPQLRTLEFQLGEIEVMWLTNANN